MYAPSESPMARMPSCPLAESRTTVLSASYRFQMQILRFGVPQRHLVGDCRVARDHVTRDRPCS